MPLISIIIATYNASSTLRRCLDSIVPQLTVDTELIIIDGQSTDDTNAIVRSYGTAVTVHISEPDKGIYDAWNKGIGRATGQWIMFIGADDILLPGAIDTYLHVLRSTVDIASYDYLCARNEYVDEAGHILGLIGEAPSWQRMRRYMSAAHVASLHNKTHLFDTLGGYDLAYRICADYELLLRKRPLRYLFLGDAVIARMTSGGMSFSTAAIREAYRIRGQHHTLPTIVNSCLTAYYWLLFVTYHPRKKVAATLRAITKPRHG